jgi:hypothetical protein
VTLSIQYKSNKGEDKITFHIYREGSNKEVGRVEVPVPQSTEKQEVSGEWVYDYEEVRQKEGEAGPYEEKPKYYFTAKNKNGYTLQGSKLLEMGMEINLVVVDDDNVIIRDAPVEIKFKAEQKDGQIKPIDNPLQGKSDSNGAFKKADLIPDETEVTVNMPIERSYPLDSSSGKLITYPKELSQPNNNDHLVDKLNQIDGSEIIRNGSSGQNPIPADKLDIGKTNIIKLPVRYLAKTTSKSLNLSLPNGSSRSEIDFVSHVLGNTYLGTSIKIEEIQIFVQQGGRQVAGLPSLKHIQDVLNHFTVQIVDNDLGANNNSLHNTLFNAIVNDVTAFSHVINISDGVSLPNKIIFFKQGSLSNDLFIHEVFHQYQYAKDGKGDTFKKLIQEMYDNLRGSNQLSVAVQLVNPSNVGNPLPQVPPAGTLIRYNSYSYLDHANLQNKRITNLVDLQQIQTREGQARFIQDFTAAAYISGSNFGGFKGVIQTPSSGITTNL